MVAKMSRKEIEEAMAFENEIQQDVNYVPTEQETEESNWLEYQKNKNEHEKMMDAFVEDLLALD